MSQKFSIRPMEFEEVERLAIEWAAREGWNPGLYDAKAFHSSDPKGFLLGSIDDEPIGCISAIRYNAGFAFMGFYIVRPEFRGEGFGYELWQAAMKHCGNRNIGLDGVVEQQDNYKKSGFSLAYNNIRYECKSRLPEGNREIMVQLGDAPLNELLRYDAKCFPAGRKRFLENWIHMPASYGLALKDGGTIKGYGLIRQCRKGSKIGPLFADNAGIADKLFLGLSSFAGNEGPVYLDIPEINPAAVELVSKYRMSKVFETARMYTGIFPEIDIEKVFGVTTFELG